MTQGATEEMEKNARFPPEPSEIHTSEISFQRQFQQSIDRTVHIVMSLKLCRTQGKHPEQDENKFPLATATGTKQT